MKIQVSTANAAVAGDVVLAMFNARTVAHMMHLDTRSLATHLALDEFYTGVVDLADRFAEAAIGNFKLLTWPADITLGLTPSKDPIQYLTQLRTYLTAVLDTIPGEDLKNILAEVLELINTTTYKLENLS